MKDNKPLVSFVIFSYNQQEFIEEAVHGALSQTYRPLEIIFSDDKSDDDTYSIIKRATQEYSGDCLIKVIRNKENMGITKHFLQRCAEAQGEIIVCAAGDDVSEPQRCEEHVARYFDQAVMAVTSSYSLIDESGRLIESCLDGPLVNEAARFQRRLFQVGGGAVVPIQGSTASYRKQIFSKALPPWRLLCSEDNMMNYLIYASGFRVDEIKAPLIRYRRHQGALTNKAKKDEPSLFDPCEYRTAAKRHINSLRLIKWLANRKDGKRFVRLDQLRLEIEDTVFAYSWARKTLLSRMAKIYELLKVGKLYRARWCVLRIFGNPYHYEPLSKIQLAIKVLKR